MFLSAPSFLLKKKIKTLLQKSQEISLHKGCPVKLPGSVCATVIALAS